MLFYAVERGFDYYSAEACARLFGMVHGRFEARVGHRFGSVIAGSFQDELPDLPDLVAGLRRARSRRTLGYDPIAAPGGAVGGPRRGGGALPRRLPPRPRRARRRRRSSSRCTRGTSATACCAASTSSTARATASRSRRPRIYGDYARTHRWFSVPGSDHHGDAKIHSSIAHHYDRPRVWIESFHTSGWGGTLEETFDWLLPWLGAGANLYNPHATYYSTRAGWWEWAPPATDWRQPYWRHYDALRARRRAAVLGADVGARTRATSACCSRRRPRARRCGSTGWARPARARDALYMDVVGRMKWFDARPGALNRLARDFDVLDDDTVAGAARRGRPRCTRAHEAYRASCCRAARCSRPPPRRA